MTPVDVTATLFPPERMPILQVVGELGVILFLFIVGLETDVTLLGKNFAKSMIISGTGIVFPFALGISISYFLHTHVMERNPDDLGVGFMLFIGVAMSITVCSHGIFFLLDRRSPSWQGF